MKKFTKICAVALAAVCAVGIAGCASSGSSSSLTSKWYVRTSYTGIQPSSIYTDGGENAKEVMVYDISYNDDGSNTVYSVSYNLDDEHPHTMTTEFYACEYDWSDSAIPEEYRSDDTETLYCYKYSFEISGSYTYTSTGETVDFSDSVENVCYFRSVRNSLQPVYSYQYTKSTSPNTFSPISAEDMCVEVEYNCTTYYSNDCTEATTYYENITEPDKSRTATVSLTGAGNTLFDNGSVYVAMRAMNITSSLSMDIDVYIPSERNYSTYNVSGADAVTLADETIKNALVGAGYVTAEDSVTYSAASLSYTGDLSGTSQTIWYATLSDDTSRNYCRSTMLKIELPISFSLGTLEFSLSEITSHFDV